MVKLVPPNPAMTRSKDKILEFPKGEERPMVKRTLSHGEYEAEFYVDPKLNPAVYHFVITRRGAAEIIIWGQEQSMSDAERSALDWMYEMTANSRAAAG